MEQSYKHIMETYAQQQKMLAKQPAWVANRTKDSEEPDELTVTHVNQTNDLLVGHPGFTHWGLKDQNFNLYFI